MPRHWSEVISTLQHSYISPDVLDACTETRQCLPHEHADHKDCITRHCYLDAVTYSSSRGSSHQASRLSSPSSEPVSLLCFHFVVWTQSLDFSSECSNTPGRHSPNLDVLYIKLTRFCRMEVRYMRTRFHDSARCHQHQCNNKSQRVGSLPNA